MWHEKVYVVSFFSGEMDIWRDVVGLLRPTTTGKPKWRTKIREIEGKRKPKSTAVITCPFVRAFSLIHALGVVFCCWGSLSSLSLCLSCCHLIFLLLLFSLSYIIFVVLRLINRGWGSSLCGSPSLLSFSHTAILICPSTFHHLKWERVLQLWCHSITTDLFLSSH